MELTFDEQIAALKQEQKELGEKAAEYFAIRDEYQKKGSDALNAKYAKLSDETQLLEAKFAAMRNAATEASE